MNESNNESADICLDSVILVTECASEFMEKSTGNIDGAIHQVLEKIGSFWEADCVYLFQTEEPAAGFTHEWKLGAHSWEERVHAYLPFLQRHWNRYFFNNNDVKIHDVTEIEASRPEAYKMLRELDIKSIYVLPLRIGDHLMGFLGMENYNTQKVSSIVGSLNAIAYFAAYALRISSSTRLRKL